MNGPRVSPRLLTAPSEAARQIMRALNLPTNTVAFTLRMRAGEIATLEVETYAEQDGAEELVTVLKRYRLEELGKPNAELRGRSRPAG